MILYVMRNAEAVKDSESLQDEWRYITEKGRASSAKISKLIGKIGPKPRLIITSPLTRAVQTAEIAAENACRKNSVAASALLLPGADNGKLLLHLKGCRDAKRVMLVGHEPQLGSLVATLLGRPDQTITLKNGACVALQIDPDKDDKPADFICCLTPGKKRVTSLKKAFPQKQP